MDKTAVLLMAYGTPNTLDEIEPYYTDIRGGRRPSPENLHELQARYARIGGRTPLLDITREQARGLQEQLGPAYCVHVGMKHWHPYIAQAVEEIVGHGHGQIIALALAPHYSRFSIDGYMQRVHQALDKHSAAITVREVKSYNDHPLYLQALAKKMQAAQTRMGTNGWADIEVVFSAHSLPERILESNDPYPQELRETCEGVARLVGLSRWRFAYQSAGRTGEKWLGPELMETLSAIARADRRRVLVAPIGFVTDHLEVIYDIDIECVEHARELGIELQRTDSLNANPDFVSALAAIVRERDEKARHPA